MGRELKFKLADTTLTSDVNQTLSNLLSQTNKVKAKVTVVEKTANKALSTANSPSLALEGLTDVKITAVANGQTIAWNGAEWVNENIAITGQNVSLLPVYQHVSGGLNGYTIVLRIPASYVQAFTSALRVGIVTTSVTGLVINAATIGKTLPGKTVWSTVPVALTWPSGSFAAASTLYLSNACSIAGDANHDIYIMVYFDPSSASGNAYAAENTTTGGASTSAASLYQGFTGEISGNHTADASASSVQGSIITGNIFCIQQVLTA